MSIKICLSFQRKAGMLSKTIDILLVEDNPGDVGLLRHSLEQVRRLKYRLVHVADLKGMAVRLGKQVFDVMLLDLSLPDSTGLETIAEARAAAPNIPIIVFTGVDDEAVGVQAVGFGAQDYVVKGEVDGWQLARAIRYAIERNRIQTELRKAYEEMDRRVQERTEQLRIAASELSTTEQRERKRVAQFLHDHFQQVLVGAKMNAESLRDRLRSKTLQPVAQRLCNLLGGLIEESRTLTSDLSPPILHGAGLSAALNWLSGQMHEAHGLVVHVETKIDPPPDRAGMSGLAFQAVRELLFNVVRHADTNEASVVVDRDRAGRMLIVVSDDGAGFDPAVLEAPQCNLGGFGLVNIRQRLELVGGKLDISSTPGKGSRFSLVVPIYPSAQ